MLPLPCARKEVEMIGKLLSVTPLIEDRATKQASKNKSVSLIHFAAPHGNAERGEIVLSPKRPIDPFPSREEDYLLTTMGISEIQQPGIG